MEYSVAFSLERMENPQDILEQEYQKLLSILFEEKLRQENGALEMQREMREYYAMWVHQIKTPISALKLLLQERTMGRDMDRTRGRIFFSFINVCSIILPPFQQKNTTQELYSHCVAKKDFS